MDILDQVEHLWTDHKKLVIAVVVVMVLLAIT
jgi:hypothetical protein